MLPRQKFIRIGILIYVNTQLLRLLLRLLSSLSQPALGPELRPNEYDHEHQRARGDTETGEHDKRPADAHRVDHEVNNRHSDRRQAAAHQVVLQSCQRLGSWTEIERSVRMR